MENQKKKLILGSFAGLIIISAIILLVYSSPKAEAPLEGKNPAPITPVMMPLVVYVQNKDVAVSGDCSATKPVRHIVEKTTAVADASLRILFDDEIAVYGDYSSVSLSNGVAKVMLKSDRTSIGAPLSSLSSCQSTHLMSVLRNTLLQYKTIQSVELHSPKGIVEL